MENCDNVVHANIVSFLTTREYVLTLSISKNIQTKSLKDKKLRMPFITVHTYDQLSSEYNKLRLYHFTKECKADPNWPKHGNIHSNRNVIATLLKFGKKCLRVDKPITFFVAPWCFRNALDLQNLVFSEQEYVLSKFNKYEEKVNQHPNLKGFYFDKLIRKRKQFQSYLQESDYYRNECEEYLENRVNRV
jgi:hypothetical protein